MVWPLPYQCSLGQHRYNSRSQIEQISQSVSSSDSIPCKPMPPSPVSCSFSLAVTAEAAIESKYSSITENFSVTSFAFAIENCPVLHVSAPWFEAVCGGGRNGEFLPLFLFVTVRVAIPVCSRKNPLGFLWCFLVNFPSCDIWRFRAIPLPFQSSYVPLVRGVFVFLFSLKKYIFREKKDKQQTCAKTDTKS